MTAFDLLYGLGLALLSPVWGTRILRHPAKYRQGWRAKLFGELALPPARRPRVWCHAVSVGEVNLLRPLIRELNQRYPDWEICLSTTTQAGMQVARQKYPDVISFYCPFDFSWAVERAFSRVKPNLLLLAELEIWPQLIAAAKRRGVAVAVVNGRLSERSFRGYRLVRPLICRTFERLDAVGAQDITTAERFEILGVPADRVVVTGSLKFDGAQTDRWNPETQRLRRLAGIAADEVVFLAGSTQEGEEAAAISVFRNLYPRYPQLRLIVVPRHPERFDAVAAYLETTGLPWVRRSQLDRTGELGSGGQGSLSGISHQETGPDRKTPRPIILVDTVGELGAWWGLANIAFVGGSFGNRGGQNMLEPAGYGAAVCFGPNTWNFRDIVHLLLEAEAAVVVQNVQGLEQFVHRCLSEPSYAAALGERARKLVLSHRGATARTLEMLAPYLERRAMSVPQRRSA